jgi:hypothetical protein
MTELVVAVFDTSSTADAALQDLRAARIPSAVIRKERGGSALRRGSNAVWHRSASAWQRPLVTVAVDDVHAHAVTGILSRYGPLRLEERATQHHLR